MRMSYGGDQLWLGDKKGLIHLVDATDGDFNLVQVSDFRSLKPVPFKLLYNSTFSAKS